MTRHAVLTLALAVALAAESPVEAPQLGFVRTNRGFRSLSGIAGNFLPGELLPNEVLGAARLGDTLFVKLETELLIGDTSIDAPPGPALFALDLATRIPYVWFESARQLWRLDTPTRIFTNEPEGQVRAFRIRNGIPEFLSEPTVTFDSDGRLWRASATLLWCGDHSWPLDEPAIRIDNIGNGWIAVHSAGAIRVARFDDAKIYMLPVAP